jgi:hypothetical protein
MYIAQANNGTLAILAWSSAVMTSSCISNPLFLLISQPRLW